MDFFMTGIILTLLTPHGSTLPGCIGIGGVNVGQQCLKFSQDKLSWEEAKSSCSSDGSVLASIIDAEAVMTYSSETFGDRYFYVGGSDAAIEGTWKWLNGNPVSTGQFPWNTGEPNNAGGIEDCLVVYGEYGFNDVPCDLKSRYICDLGETSNVGGLCSDSDRTCSYLAEIGECQKHTSFMKNNCKKSCNYCPSTTTPTPESTQAAILPQIVGLNPGAPKGDEFCVWDLNKEFDATVTPPLILIADGAATKFVLPLAVGNKRIIRVQDTQHLYFSCPGNKNKLHVNDKQDIVAKCSGNKIFSKDLAPEGVEMSKMICDKRIESTIKPRSVEPILLFSNYNGILYDIGFETGQRGFFPLIEVCFNDMLSTTIWTKHTLHGKNLIARYPNNKYDTWKTSNLFPTKKLSLEDIYKRKSQEKLIEEKLQNKTLAKLFPECEQNICFEKGHMSPQKDFITKAGQDATYYYSNCLPQWKGINNGNWGKIEDATEHLAKARGDLIIISGGHNILQLNHINKNENPVKIFLGNLNTVLDKVPAPQLTWKVVYHKSKSEAVGFVVINNPLIVNYPTPVPLCPDECERLKWLLNFGKTLRHNVTRGYTYCCNIADLRSKITTVPDIGNVKLLTTLR